MPGPMPFLGPRRDKVPHHRSTSRGSETARSKSVYSRTVGKHRADSASQLFIWLHIHR